MAEALVMNTSRLISLVLASGIAMFSGIQLAAGMDPPIYPIPGIIVLIAFVGSLTLAAAQTQVSSWKDADSTVRPAINEVHARVKEGKSPLPPSVVRDGSATDRQMTEKPPG